MVRAHAQGMDGGGYQFLFIKTTLVTSEELADLESTALWERGLPDDEGARQGFENLLYVRNVKILKFKNITNLQDNARGIIIIGGNVKNSFWVIF